MKTTSITHHVREDFQALSKIEQDGGECVCALLQRPIDSGVSASELSFLANIITPVDEGLCPIEIDAPSGAASHALGVIRAGLDPDEERDLFDHVHEVMSDIRKEHADGWYALSSDRYFYLAY